MSKKNKREWKNRNPVARDMNERRGAFKLRTIHPKKRQKPKPIKLSDIRDGKFEDDE